MVYSTRRFVLPCVILFLCFSVLIALRLPRLGKRELILVLFVRLFELCLLGFVGFLFLLVFSYSWCLGRAAVCDCGSPWTFLLPFFFIIISCFIEIPVFNAKSVDADQTPRSAASDLCLHCFGMSF